MKILLCDDDSEACRAVGTYLGWHGFETNYAASLSELKDQLRENAYDLLVLSLILPCEGGGRALITEVSGLAEKEKVPPKVLFTGPELPEENDWRLLKKKGFYFMNQYSLTEEWLEKIAIIAHKAVPS